MIDFLKKIVRFCLKFLLWFLLITIAWVVLYRFVNPPFTPLMGVRWVQTKFDKDETNNKIYYEWTDLKNISPYMPLAVMASEDQHFLTHWGFDFAAIQTAVEFNKTHKHKIGASTISQQVAKNVFLWQNRNFIRKGLEAYFTCLIELLWSKKRIMEVYLNVVEMNKNRFGVQQGSIYAFNRQAKNMSAGQCALLAAILPGPRLFSAKYPSGYIQVREAQIVQQIGFLGIDVKKEFGY